MTLPSAKDLKKLADSCRKAGIKHFKSGDLEFTLSDELPPVSNYKKSKAKVEHPTDTGVDPNFTYDDLTQEQLLYWSIGSQDTEERESTQ